MEVTLDQIAKQLAPLLQPLTPTENVKVLGICSPDFPLENHMVFVPNEKSLLKLQNAKALAAVVIPEKLKGQATSFKVVLTSPSPSLAMAMTARNFFPETRAKQPFDGEKIHSSAVISNTAKVAEDVIIGPNTTIGPGCELSSGCRIGANTTLEADVKVGEGTHIHSQVYIAYGAQIGKNCEIQPQSCIGSEGFGYAQDQDFNHHRITHYGRIVIADNVHIGAGVMMDRGTFADSFIGSGTRIDNQCHFGHNIQIGEKTLITGGALVAGSVRIGSRCIIGGRTSISGHLSICDDVHIGGLSGVTKDIKEPGKYGGYPLQSLQNSLKSLATLPSLPEMRKKISELEKKR